jgi:hypothetical protein
VLKQIAHVVTTALWRAEESIDKGENYLTERGGMWLRLTILLLNIEIVEACSSVIMNFIMHILGYRSGGPGSIPGTTRKKK